MISIRNVRKRFGNVVALDGIDLEIAAGEVVALWGPNGAGKTTLLRCMLGVIPFEGDIEIQGISVQTRGKQARYLVGFVPQEIGFHDNFTVFEALKFYAGLKRAPLDAVEYWLRQVGLDGSRRQKIRKLSGGMKQRLALAIALLADPPVLLLDEPTANLDQKSREEFLDLLADLKAKGKTLVFCSHRLDEVVPLADRIVLMEAGRILRVDDLQRAAASQLSSQRLRIFVPRDQISRALTLLQEGNFSATANGRGIWIRVNGRGKVQPLALLLQSGIYIEDFEYETME